MVRKSYSKFEIIIADLVILKKYLLFKTDTSHYSIIISRIIIFLNQLMNSAFKKIMYL